MFNSNMRISSRFFVMAVFLQVVIAGTRKYFADLAYDHKKSDSEFLSEYTARSLTFCTALCGFSCGCFGFNAKDKKCRVYNPCNQADITVAEAGWRNYFPEALPRDCHDLHVEDSVEFGVNQVYPFDNTTSLHVQCYMETNDTWWTVIQRRRSGSINFNRTWADYKGGFGNLGDSFWLGNEVIHELTKARNTSLYLSITLKNNMTLYELYNQFSVEDETNRYQLFLGGPVTGTLGDSMLHSQQSYYELSGMYFSTIDRDNDQAPGHCAVNRDGGWWFNYCADAFLNGPWYPEYWHRPWNPTLTDGKQIKETLMMIKPH